MAKIKRRDQLTKDYIKVSVAAAVKRFVTSRETLRSKEAVKAYKTWKPEYKRRKYSNGFFMNFQHYP